MANKALKGYSAFAPVEAGTHDLEVRLAGSTTVVLPLNGIILQAGKIHTVSARDLVGGAGSQALGAQIIVNNRSPTSRGGRQRRVSPDRGLSNREETRMKSVVVIVAVLPVLGGLNWGLVALADFDLVAFVTRVGGFGAKNALGATVYGLVGLSALCQSLLRRSIQRRWGRP